MSSRISSVRARQILDSRGRPTVEADVMFSGGSWGRACAPSGASTGRHEALELRDRDHSQYEGLGVRAAVNNVLTEISDCVVGLDGLDQSALDLALIRLDGSSSLNRLGANAVLAVSLACARAAASHSGLPLYRYLASLLPGSEMCLPMPMTNILSGGAHANRGMDFQDFLVVPVGAQSYTEALHMISQVRNQAAVLMRSAGLPVLLADEGGLSPGYSQAERALELMMASFQKAGYRAGSELAIALDIAASELYSDGKYLLPGEQLSLSGTEMSEFVQDLARRYPIISIEDALEQDDWSTWQHFTAALPAVQIVGDDLFATNVERISKGVALGVANAALIKLNQNGTLSGTLAAIRLSRESRYATVVSARSGETEDTFIADFAVGIGAGQIKIGSVRNSERLGKYNQLLRIEEESGLPFAGVTKLGGRLPATV
jgi:enolase